MFRRIVSVIGPAAAAVALAATPASAAATSYSGQATAVRASVFGVNVALADTGPLPSSGGSQSASLIGANVPGVVTADLLTASTSGSHGDITVNAVHVFGPGVDIAIASSHADIDCA